jgi:prevent-host-death family protein
MSASRFSTSDLSRKSGDLIAEALRHPVTITQRNKPRLVLMNVEDYERLMVQADPRKAALTKDMPEDLLDQVEGAIDAYAESGPD